MDRDNDVIVIVPERFERRLSEESSKLRVEMTCHANRSDRRGCRVAMLSTLFTAGGALEQWVERGTKPAQEIASHSANGVIDRTRPLCPYPQVANDKGSGSIDESANFVCK